MAKKPEVVAREPKPLVPESPSMARQREQNNLDAARAEKLGLSSVAEVRALDEPMFQEHRFEHPPGKSWMRIQVIEDGRAFLWLSRPTNGKGSVIIGFALTPEMRKQLKEIL